CMPAPLPGSDSQGNSDLRKISRNLSLTFAASGDTGHRSPVQLISATEASRPPDGNENGYSTGLSLLIRPRSMPWRLRLLGAATSTPSSVYCANVVLYAYGALRPTAGSSMSTSDGNGTRRFSDTCVAASGSTGSKAAAKITRVEDRNSVPTQPKNHRLMIRMRVNWNTALCTTQLASIIG